MSFPSLHAVKHEYVYLAANWLEVPKPEFPSPPFEVRGKVPLAAMSFGPHMATGQGHPCSPRGLFGRAIPVSDEVSKRK